MYAHWSKGGVIKKENKVFLILNPIILLIIKGKIIASGKMHFITLTSILDNPRKTQWPALHISIVE